ncbi:hypothetical protein TSOC111612_23160 [Tsukamurella ocularis]|uniref:Uncharacterized protein n=1 Tax=Tsukamurella pseudospumae TaxID=239498 RepID=A0A138AU76_9ACTN|nr:hypothetical protein [Tsukamurella pseudospumae]KXP13936.1 hypothetical protein AXK60_22800 [Tsukamurella pseudospumae]
MSFTPSDDRTLVEVIHESDDTLYPLHEQYEGQHEPQPAYIELQLGTGRLGTYVNPHIGGSEPRHHHGEDRLYEVENTKMSSQAVNALLDELIPLAQRVLDGADTGINYLSGNRYATLDADAEEAEEQIAEAIRKFRYEGPGVTDEQRARLVDSYTEQVARDLSTEWGSRLVDADYDFTPFARGVAEGFVDQLIACDEAPYPLPTFDWDLGGTTWDEFTHAVESGDVPAPQGFGLKARVARLLGDAPAFTRTYGNPEVKAWVDEDNSIVEVRAERLIACSRCGQSVRVSGRVAEFDQAGTEAGGFDHQHGCGAWTEPTSAVLRVTSGTSDDELADLITDVINADDADQGEREDAARDREAAANVALTEAAEALREARDARDEAESAVETAQDDLDEAQDAGRDTSDAEVAITAARVALAEAESAVEAANEAVQEASGELADAEAGLY